MRTKFIQKNVPFLFMLISIIFAVGIFLFPFKEVRAASQTVTRMGTDDATAWSGAPDTNYGSITSNEAGYNAGDDRYFFLKFQDLNIPADGTITSARIKLTKGSSCSGTDAISVRRLLQSWGENTVTYNNKPTFTLIGGTEYSPNCANSTWYLDATEIVNSWKSGTPNYGVVVWGQQWGNYFYTFRSTEYGTLAVKPQLEITYTTPDPAAPETPSSPSTPSQGSSNPSSTPAATSPSGEAVSESAVLVPKLVEIQVNGTPIEGRNTSITVKEDDVVVVNGSAPAGSKVTVTIGSKEYTATADGYGDWSLTLKMSDFEDGKYEVFAKAVTADNKESEKIKLFTFEKKKDPKVAKVTEEVNFYKQNLPYIVGACSVLLALAVLMTILYIRKHRHVKTLLKAHQAGPKLDISPKKSEKAGA